MEEGVIQVNQRRNKLKQVNSMNKEQEEVFDSFYDNNKYGGSSRWDVSPDTVKRFIEIIMLRNKYQQNIDHVCDKCDLVVTETSKDGIRLVDRELKQRTEEWEERGLLNRIINKIKKI